MFYYLYQITNNVNGKIYIGVHKTADMNDGYMGSGKIIKRAIVKHGIENFTKTILEEFETSEQMFSREKEVVTEEFLAREDTYNLRRGGFGGFDYINANKDELYYQQKVLAGKQIDIKYGPEYRRELLRRSQQALAEHKINKTGKYADDYISPLALRPDIQEMGRLLTLTPEAKAKRRKTLKGIDHQQGEKNSQFGSRWISKDGKSIKIKQIDLQHYLTEGWSVGRIQPKFSFRSVDSDVPVL